MSEWIHISKAPRDRDIMLKGKIIHSDYHFKNTGIRASEVEGTGRWIYGDHWSGILGGRPTYWKEITP